MKSQEDLAAADLAAIETEQRNPRTLTLDALPTEGLIEVLHAENYRVCDAVGQVLPQIVTVVDILADRLGRGGRLLYIGAGTSGRLGVLDASECPPTFGVPQEMVQGIIAGGYSALTTSIEGAEDNRVRGAEDILDRSVCSLDVVVGIAASGRTPYVIGALDRARSAGAVTVAVVNVRGSELEQHADITIAAVTGAEALTGSTRLKAGTAQKLILNLLTTATMVRLGKVYSNLMVDVRATNAKLLNRAVRIVMSAADVDVERAELALSKSGWNAKIAIVMLIAQVSADQAVARLEAAGGWVGTAILAQ